MNKIIGILFILSGFFSLYLIFKDYNDPDFSKSEAIRFTMGSFCLFILGIAYFFNAIES